jgi:tetratricopeptide (TPR) repeat protein
MRTREELESRLAELRAEERARRAAAAPPPLPITFIPPAFGRVVHRDVKPQNDAEPEVAEVIHVSFGTNERRAYALYSAASAIDEDPAQMADAEVLYKQAIRVAPRLAIAYTNLGNIRCRRGDPEGAMTLYATALGIDPVQPEALYNAGYVFLERGRVADAIDHFTRALDADPHFADAHFNLATAFEQVGDHARALPHWRAYVTLEPLGTWAEMARQHMHNGVRIARGKRRRARGR